ncbi:HpcH/HpaI aldolase/citrate lyase family protein [Sphingomonas lenta]|uniref:CoA ester lyase n=1 Tax=Sphingomonas lenta TaxID=1141887 RepID=A0A2A2SBT5_9SPHN|nr:CoA ester lyase [Sphingomonas lenta]PAX06716.1 CoA ester lyase [Sphingomonas lenta]
MRLRSLLFVPGDRPDRFAKAAGSQADAMILDLEDSVAAPAKAQARQAVSDYLTRTPPPVRRFVRINPVDAGMLAEDLAAARGADGLVLPKAEGLRTLEALGVVGLPVLPVATETPAAIFGLSEYARSPVPLAGITWGAEDLPAAVGAATSREPDGRYTPPYELARSLTLFAAHAAGVPAIETVYPAIKDGAGLAAYAARGSRDGFTGMLAIHPAQVPIINRAFTPDEATLAHARAVVAAFAANPDAGALQLDGRMIDLPHLKQAHRLLAMAGEESTTLPPALEPDT